MECRNSPVAKTPPSDLPDIPGVTSPSVEELKVENNHVQNDDEKPSVGECPRLEPTPGSHRGSRRAVGADTDPPEVLWDLVARFSWLLGSGMAHSNVKMSSFWCNLYPVISFLINLAFSRMPLHRESRGEGMGAAVPAPAYPLPFCSCFALFESDQVTVQSRIYLGIFFYFFFAPHSGCFM